MILGLFIVIGIVYLDPDPKGSEIIQKLYYSKTIIKEERGGKMLDSYRNDKLTLLEEFRRISQYVTDDAVL